MTAKPAASGESVSTEGEDLKSGHDLSELSLIIPVLWFVLIISVSFLTARYLSTHHDTISEIYQKGEQSPSQQ